MKEVQSLFKGQENFDVTIISPVCTDVGLYLAKEILDTPIVVFWAGNY